VIRLATDQDFNARIVSGLRRRVPDLDVMSVRDVGLATAPDPEILEWAAREQRVLLSHDVSTLVGFADERCGEESTMQGSSKCLRHWPSAMRSRIWC
jgi:predicted nuclease of predicted toxin-antitoxin system